MSPNGSMDALVDAIAHLERPLLVALDVDGTLAPIVEDPSRAKVPTATARTLRHLRTVEGLELALVTGRDAGQLERIVSIPGVWRVVEHGRAIIAPGEKPRGVAVEAEDRRKLARFKSWAHEHAGPRGAHVEEKDASVVVHVRKMAKDDPEGADAVLAEARDAAAELGLCVRDGRAVVEAQLEPFDKGAALRELIEAVGATSVLYAGDDLTDEPAIRVAAARGFGLFVRSAERERFDEATASLDGPEGVSDLLDALLAKLKP
ncbi:MAG: trehalose-phosphatase [Sandaracinaceae bacterium]